LKYNEVDAAYLSQIDLTGKLSAYQIGSSDTFPPYIEESLSCVQVANIFEQTEISVMDQLPLRYVTQNKKSLFTELMTKNGVFSFIRLPLCQLNNRAYFLFLFSKKDLIESKALIQCVEGEKERLVEQVLSFFVSMDKIKDIFLSYRKILELKGDETFSHMERVAIYSYKIAIQTWHLARILRRKDILDEFTPFTFETLKLAATIHDVGKLAIPENILNKPSKLTKEEFEIIKTHSEKGLEIINTAFSHETVTRDDIYSPELYSIIDMTKEIIHQHHERLDGSGYPRGLKNNEIGLFSKIVSVADVFDAITSKRIYKASQSTKSAIKEMMQDQFDKYDPLILEALLRTQNMSLLQSVQS